MHQILQSLATFLFELSAVRTLKFGSAFLSFMLKQIDHAASIKESQKENKNRKNRMNFLVIPFECPTIADLLLPKELPAVLLSNIARLFHLE